MREGSPGQSLAEMALLTLLVSMALVLLLGAFRESVSRAALDLTRAIALPFP